MNKVPPKFFPFIFLCKLLKLQASPSHVTCKKQNQKKFNFECEKPWGNFNI